MSSNPAFEAWELIKSIYNMFLLSTIQTTWEETVQVFQQQLSTLDKHYQNLTNHMYDKFLLERPPSSVPRTTRANLFVNIKIAICVKIFTPIKISIGGGGQSPLATSSLRSTIKGWYMGRYKWFHLSLFLILENLYQRTAVVLVITISTMLSLCCTVNVTGLLPAFQFLHQV